MARNADLERERIGQEVSVHRLAEGRGIELRVLDGAESPLVGVCPLCEGVDGLAIEAKANTWGCLLCGEGGGPVEWMMATKGVSQRHAVELLRDPPSVDDGAKPVARNSKALLESPFEVAMSDEELLGELVGFYHRTFMECAEPTEFLESRRLASADAFETFGFGFANRTLGYLLPQSNRAAGKDLRGRLQDLGVFKANGRELFRGSLVVPVRDIEGRVVQIYGRKIGGGLRKTTARHNWLASGDRPLFNAAALAATDEVILAGSVIDALTFWCAGFRHVVAVDGVEGFDPTHLDLLTGNDIARVLIAFRRDDSGQVAAKSTAKTLMVAGVECFGVGFPTGMDANDYACRSANVTDAFAKLLRGVTWMGKGKGPARRQRSPQATGASTVLPDVEAPPAGIDEETPEDTGDEREGEGEAPEGWIEGLSIFSALQLDEVTPLLGRDGDEMQVTFGCRWWRVRGLAKNTSFDVLKVNVMMAPTTPPEQGLGVHVDSLDLYSARARATFAKDAAAEVGVEEKILARDINKVFMAAEGLVDEAIARAHEPKEVRRQLTETDRAAAMELLCDPNLVDRIVADFERVGIVGESTNCLVGYLATVSRLLERPLAVVVQSTSAAGKTALQDAVLEFVPPDDRIAYSAMTGQSLYYLGENDLCHKVLAIAEEEGAERASYALKLLQSEGELSIASTGKNNASGRLETQPYRVKGPAAIFLTTTAIDVDEELLNRCMVLTVDEDRDQTRAIHVRQRRAQTLDGLLAANSAPAIVKQHQDAQSLLVDVAVVNPYADQLTFADVAPRTRRDHVKYLTLIRTIALLHQHQRPRRTATAADGAQVSYIEATLADIALANRLAHEVLGRSLDDLPPVTRRLLEGLDEMATAIAEGQGIDRDRVRFTRRQVRERLGWGDTTLKKHLGRLVDLEMVWCHRAERSGGFVYELAWTTGHDGDRFLPGLVEVDTLAADTTATTGDRSGPEPGSVATTPDRSPPGRPPVAPKAPPGRPAGNGTKGQANGHKPAAESAHDPERASGVDGNESPYPHEGAA